MINIDELRQHIDSVEDLQSIVRVMKTLSAVSIQKYQSSERRLRDYQEVIDRGLLAVTMAGSADIVLSTESADNNAVIVFGSDQGLCGRFNELVVDCAKKCLKEFDQEDIPIMAVGQRCAARLEFEGVNPTAAISQPGSVAGFSETVELILLTLNQWHRQKRTDTVIAISNFDVGQGRLETRSNKIIPLDRNELQRIECCDWPTNQIPTFDGNPREVFSALVRERLYISLMHVGAASLAAEHATRLSAMQAAEKNITDKLQELEMEYRRGRQGAITEELIDIVSAFESLSESR